MINDYYDFAIAGHFLPALINGDYTGLDDTEAKQLDQFVDQWQHLSGTFDVLPTGTDFKVCEVCDLYAETHDVRLYFYNKDLPAGVTFDAFAD
jgi:hypothetical protein